MEYLKTAATRSFYNHMEWDPALRAEPGRPGSHDHFAPDQPKSAVCPLDVFNESFGCPPNILPTSVGRPPDIRRHSIKQ